MTSSDARPDGAGDAPAPSDEEVLAALASVIDPELGDDVVDLGMVRDVAVSAGGTVTVRLALTVAGCPLRAQLERDVQAKVGRLPGVRRVAVEMAEMGPAERRALMDRARAKAQEGTISADLGPSTRVLAVASGKGGVGKSSVTVNLAAALARRGLTVGVLDADIWGFSVPRLLGLDGRLEARGSPEDWAIVPMEQQVAHGSLRVVSMGLLAEGEDEAIMWRGLLLSRALQHFIENVHWGRPDYLLVDMPPGTGDIQMALARMLPRTEMLIVTTPPLAAVKVAARVADMARKGHLRVAGVVENMGPFRCEHGTTYPLFGEGGGRQLAEQLGVPLVGTVPLDPELCAAGDAGSPPALGDGPVASAFAGIADRLAVQVPPRMEMAGCTARMLDRVEEALAGAPEAGGRPEPGWPAAVSSGSAAGS
jgi:ATP-binding protein involved in chromosome partitioning